MATAPRSNDAASADDQDAPSIFRANTQQEAHELGFLSSELPSQEAQHDTNKQSHGLRSQGLQTELNSVTVAATNKNCYNASGIGRGGAADNLGGDELEDGRIVVDLQSSVPSIDTFQKGNTGTNNPVVGKLGSDLNIHGTEEVGIKDESSLCHSAKVTPAKQP